MAKSSKTQTQPNPNAVPNKDVIQRLNFLDQASTYLSQVIPSTQLPETSSEKHCNAVVSKRRKRKRTVEHISREMVGQMRDIGLRSVQRVDSSVKRRICKVCHTQLIPGINCGVRVKPSSSHMHKIRWKCLHCASVKSLAAPPIIPNKHEQLADASTYLSKSQRKHLRRAKEHPELSQRSDKHVVFRGQEQVYGEEIASHLHSTSNAPDDGHMQTAPCS